MSWMRWLNDDQVALNDLQRKLKIERVRAARLARSGAGQREDERMDQLERQVLRLEAGLGAVVRLLHDKGIVQQAELERAVLAHVTEAEERVSARDAAAAGTERQRSKAQSQRRPEKRRRG